MSDSNIFDLQISQFVEKAKGNIDIVVRKVALDLFSRVILKTPVDTGRLRGSWCVSIGALAPKTIEVEDKTGTVTIARVTADTLNLKAGDVVYLSTTLEYAGVIEYGHSKQAPEGMVRLTILEFNQALNRAVTELPK